MHLCDRCVHVFVCTYVCLFMSTCVYVCTWACICMRLYECTCKQLWLCVLIHEYMCVCSACFCLYQTLWKNVLLSCTCNNYNHWSQRKAIFSPQIKDNANDHFWSQCLKTWKENIKVSMGEVRFLKKKITILVERKNENRKYCLKKRTVWK